MINGLHAISESKRSDGRIIVEIQRSGQQALDVDNVARSPIETFVIRDNGIGFTDENYESFRRSDTQKKAKIGGRGVGRLTWVKAFEDIRVESVFKTDGKLRRRRFRFSEQGITDHVVEDTPPDTKEHGVIVRLSRMRSPFYKALPKGLATIGLRMVDHFLVALRKSDASVTIEDGDETFDVTQEIEIVLRTAESSQLKIQGHVFKLTHVKVTSNDVRGHRLAYLADHRQVKSDSLSGEVPHLRSRLQDDEAQGFWSLTLAESSALDSAVTAERDKFHFPDEPDPLFPEQLTMKEIRDAIIPKIVTKLEPYLTPLRNKAASQARDYVEREAPQYRHLLKAKKVEVEALPPDLGPEKLDAELRKIQFRHEAELRDRASAILASGSVDDAAYAELVSEANAAAIGELAKYVKQRRVILNLLNKAIRLDSEGKRALEEAIHKLVLPMKKTSDDVPYEQLNLWLIDERLAFHGYLASDKPFSTLAPIESTAEERPDVVVFNRPIAFSEGTQFGSVVIVEFKRPMRSEYDDSENPIAQVLGYVRRVRAGTAQTHDGRPFTVAEPIPFYCYVICDLTPKLREFAENAALTSAWDSQGYFGYIPAQRAYVEVISFTKLVDDAEKRNRVFFEKLGLPKA